MMRATALLDLVRRLHRDTRAISVVEFAAAAPLLIFGTLGGLETAQFLLTNMRINQIAVSLADNASRMKQQTISGAPKVREYDVNEAFKAAERQSDDLKLLTNGRMILSSLEVKDGTPSSQIFHWQRCQGAKTGYASEYGKQNEVIPGAGPAGKRITAEKDAAIMVAEVIYEYQPLVMTKMFSGVKIRKYSAMYVRDDRDLSSTGISNPAPMAPVSNC